jgi:hypothetical protein
MPSSRSERLRAQAGVWRADRAEHGIRHATVRRIRQLLDIGPVTTGRVDQMSHQIESLGGRADHLDEYSRGVAAAVTGAEREATSARDAAVALVAAEQGARELVEQVWALTAWLETVPVAEDALVSVVLPTRGRRDETLRRAVDSVLAQGYERWQLIVVVDGDDEVTAAVRNDLPDDDRIDVVRSSGTGVSAARNTGLDQARGDLIAYLDDDNLMGPQWLRAVAWAGVEHPDVELFYGAELIDEPRERGRAGTIPTLHLAPFDRRRLARGNYIDQNAVAHRRSLPEAHYDESLAANVDWDFLLRATARREPLLVPVVASLYRTGAPDRLTVSEAAAPSWGVVSARARSLAPLRVLALNQLYPLLTETYISDDLDALAANGADVTCCVIQPRVAPARSPYPLYHDPARAVAEHDPDVVLVHWGGFGKHLQPVLHHLGVPYAVRTHSFADEPQMVRQLVDDPLCVGVWCFEHHAFDHPRVHSLPIVFTAADRLPPLCATRDLVLSVSATLPKKDFPFIVDAFAGIPGVDRRIVIGATAGHEDLVLELLGTTKELEDPPLVQMNLTRGQVFELLARTSALVYNATAESGFGCPMSVVEAMTAGACVLLPAREEVPLVFGPDARTFTSREDLVEHLWTILAGGPAVDAERLRVRNFALERFCDPEAGKRFYAELVDAVTTSRPVS